MYRTRAMVQAKGVGHPARETLYICIKLTAILDGLFRRDNWDKRQLAGSVNTTFQYSIVYLPGVSSLIEKAKEQIEVADA